MRYSRRVPRPSPPRRVKDYVTYTNLHESTIDWSGVEQNTLARAGYYHLYHDMHSLRQSVLFSIVLMILGICCLFWWYAYQ